MAFNGWHLQNEFLLKFLLYGSETLNFEENKAVLTATLKFIHESARIDNTKE